VVHTKKLDRKGPFFALDFKEVLNISDALGWRPARIYKGRVSHATKAFGWNTCIDVIGPVVRGSNKVLILYVDKMLGTPDGFDVSHLDAYIYSYAFSPHKMLHNQSKVIQGLFNPVKYIRVSMLPMSYHQDPTSKPALIQKWSDVKLKNTSYRGPSEQFLTRSQRKRSWKSLVIRMNVFHTCFWASWTFLGKPFTDPESMERNTCLNVKVKRTVRSLVKFRNAQ